MPNMIESTFAERGARIPCSLNGATATTSGSWQPAGFQPFTVSIEGDFNGTVQIYGSLYPVRNTPPPGPDASYPPLLSVEVSGPQLLTFPMSLSWWKAVVTFPESPSGSCSAYAFVG